MIAERIGSNTTQAAQEIKVATQFWRRYCLEELFLFTVNMGDRVLGYQGASEHPKAFSDKRPLV